MEESYNIWNKDLDGGGLNNNKTHIHGSTLDSVTVMDNTTLSNTSHMRTIPVIGDGYFLAQLRISSSKKKKDKASYKQKLKCP